MKIHSIYISLILICSVGFFLLGKSNQKDEPKIVRKKQDEVSDKTKKNLDTKARFLNKDPSSPDSNLIKHWKLPEAEFHTIKDAQERQFIFEYYSNKKQLKNFCVSVDIPKKHENVWLSYFEEGSLSGMSYSGKNLCGLLYVTFDKKTGDLKALSINKNYLKESKVFFKGGTGSVEKYFFSRKDKAFFPEFKKIKGKLYQYKEGKYEVYRLMIKGKMHEMINGKYVPVEK